MRPLALDEDGRPIARVGFAIPPAHERWVLRQIEERAKSTYVGTGNPRLAIALGVLPEGTPHRDDLPPARF